MSTVLLTGATGYLGSQIAQEMIRRRRSFRVLLRHASASPSGLERFRAQSYEATKAEALAWLRGEGFRKYPVVALLPGVIYGPGPETEGNLMGGMIRQYLAADFPGLLGSGKQRWSFAFNADVVAAHLSALDSGR